VLKPRRATADVPGSVADDDQDLFCWKGGAAAAAALAPGAAAPRRRGRSRLAGVAIAAIAAAIAALLLLRGGGTPSPVTPLARAADVTGHAPGYRFRLTLDASGGGRDEALSASGAFNTQPLNGSISLEVAGKTVNELLVPPYAYVQIPSAGSSWERVRLAALGTSAPVSGVDVQQTIAFLRSVGSVSDEGSQTIEGVPTTHYHAAVDVDRLAGVIPLAQGSTGASLAELSRVLGGAGMPLDVWVDSQDRVRRLTMSLSLRAGANAARVSVSLQLYDYGAQPAVKAPPPRQVSDLGGVGQGLSG
jgi:hypothetical protein